MSTSEPAAAWAETVLAKRRPRPLDVLAQLTNERFSIDRFAETLERFYALATSQSKSHRRQPETLAPSTTP